MSIWERYDDLVASNAEDQNELTRLRAREAVLVKALTGLMEIAEQAMPDTYFQTDSRVNAARKALATLDVEEKM